MQRNCAQKVVGGEGSGILPEVTSGRVVVPCELERDVLLACCEGSSPMSPREVFLNSRESPVDRSKVRLTTALILGLALLL